VSNLAHSTNNQTRTDALPNRKAFVLYIDRIMINNFRSYKSLNLNVGAQSVVLTGANGVGKTNLLEAISYLSSGSGLRGAKLSDINKIGASNSWTVASRLITPDGERNLGSGLIPRSDLATEFSTDRRTVRLDGETLSSPAAFNDILQITWLTPQMDRLFVDGPSGRRRFLDRLVAAYHPTHTREVNAYEKVMRDRNRLLLDRNSDAVWIETLEKRMAEHGVAVAAARLDAIDKLGCAIAESNSLFPKAFLSLEGNLENGLLCRPAVEIEAEFCEQLFKARKYDSISGRASVGPHRTDLNVTHGPKNMPAEFCSTGEQKALLIGITLASARLSSNNFGAPPILLLDEIAAHLDIERRGTLFDELNDIGSQVWSTGTDKSLFDQMRNRTIFFHIENGEIREN
jgi:DNA replication and repair protein RecF